MSATIVYVDALRVHPNADNLDILTLQNGVELVTGQHYEKGQLGIWVPPDHVLPGWIAEDLWMVKKGDKEVLITERIMRGIPSPGIFIGAKWQNTRKSAWQNWPMWRDRWLVGQDVSEYLGVREANPFLD